MNSVSLFKSQKEFIVVSIILILIIVARVTLLNIDYKKLKSLNGYYYTDAKIERIYSSKYKDSHLFKLKSQEGFKFFIYSHKSGLKRGDWVRAKLKLKEDTNFWEYLKGFFAYGNILEYIQSQITPKEDIKKIISKQHTNKDISNLYSAIFLAEPLNKTLREKISSLGISHLVALSGFHLGILWLTLYGILYIPYRYAQERFFPWRNRAIDLGLPILAILGIYILFTGSPPALVRSYIMLLVGYILLIFGLELLEFKLLAFITLLILLFEPRLIASTALFLSISGVFYIFLLIKWFKNLPPLILSVIILPILIFLLMFPVGHYFFANTTLWQLSSPILSILFSIFYPISAILHILNIGYLFDNALEWIFSIPLEPKAIQLNRTVYITYALLSLSSIFNKKLFILTIIFAIAITTWYIANL